MLKKFKLILIAFSLLFLCSTVASASNVTADFTYSVSDLDVDFDATSSVNATNWAWDFGDGNTSSGETVSFTYASAGTYTVELNASNSSTGEFDLFSDSVTVSAAVFTPSATFTYSASDLDVDFDATGSTDADGWLWDFGDGNTSSGETVSFTYASAGTYTVELNATNSTSGTFDLFSDSVTVSAAAAFTPSATFTYSASDLDVDFDATGSTDADGWLWDFGDGNTSSGETVSYTYASAGTYTVELNATNSTSGTFDLFSDSVTVSVSSTPPVASFTTNVTEGPVSLAVMFNDTSTNTPTSWSWDFGDGASSTDQHPVHTYSSTGTYNVTLEATNGDGSDTSSATTITVHSQTYYTGDRIWDADAGQSDDKYIWDAKSFSGFFYDLESGLSSENMTIFNIDRSLSEGDILYQTRPVDTDFERSGWGSYQVIGFMAEKYFAGYTDDTDIDGVEEVSLISSGQLSKILIDDDEKDSVFSGSSLELEDGYALNVVDVDVDGDSVRVTLTKDGDELDSDVVSSGEDYVYKDDLGDADDVVIVAIHFDNVFSGSESNAVFVKGIFQISDDYLELEDGESYGEMEITQVDEDLIEMENEGTISLSKGKTINLMGSINLIVADDSTLRFAPYVDMSEPGTYELRGTVAETTDLLTWTPLNFEGFYYDIDEGIQTETLELTDISGRSIDDGDLVYTSTPASVDFEHSEWGEFQVIGFMAEKYFAGYTDDTDVDGVDEVSLISNGQLSEVLIDDDDKTSVYSGRTLELEEGYTLDIVAVDTNGDSVLIELYKDGDEVDTDVVSSDSDYVYDVDLGDVDDVPLIIVHFNDVFAGSESNAVFVEGIFQISEDYLELEDGDSYGEMEITSYSDTSIVMKNEDSISLNKDKDITLMGEVGFRVADSSTLRYYPYVEKVIGTSDTLDIDLSDSTVSIDDEVTIEITARGASISEATVKVDGTTIGTTDDEGILEYTFDEVGEFEITAEKTGYGTGSKDLEVIDPDDETRVMSIEVSPEDVYEGTSMTIYVMQAIGGDAVSGAEVTFDGKSIGTTGSDGTVTYTATESGTHKIIATKSDKNDAELDFKVQELAAKFDFSNLEISPLEIKQGQKATISVDVENIGTADGSYTVDLKIDDVVVDSQEITLVMGESTTIEFEHKEEEMGTYEVKVGGLTTTYEVFEKSGTIWYVLGAISLAAVGGVAYLFTAGGWTVEIAQAKAAEAIAALKELIANMR